MKKQEEALKNTSLSSSNLAAQNNTASNSMQYELESEYLVNLVNKLATQVETRLKECGGLDGGKNHIINELIPKSTNIENLAQMDPLYYPWL